MHDACPCISSAVGDAPAFRGARGLATTRSPSRAARCRSDHRGVGDRASPISGEEGSGAAGARLLLRTRVGVRGVRRQHARFGRNESTLRLTARPLAAGNGWSVGRGAPERPSSGAQAVAISEILSARAPFMIGARSLAFGWWRGRTDVVADPQRSQLRFIGASRQGGAVGDRECRAVSLVRRVTQAARASDRVFRAWSDRRGPAEPRPSWGQP